MAITSELLPLWIKLEEQSRQLKRVLRIQAKQERLAFWPGAEMHHVPTTVMCLQGQARLFIEQSQAVTLEAGEAVVIAPGVFHQHDKIAKNCYVLMQGLTPRASDFHLRSSDCSFYGYIPLERAQDTFHRIIQESDGFALRWVEDMRKICSRILNEHVAVSNAVPKQFNRMFQYFVRFAYEGISAEDVIAISELSRSRAYALWTKHYGTPLRQAISQQRLYLAKLLLQNTDMDIRSIANRCGFRSRQQMTRLFQQQEHCSPRQWRQQRKLHPEDGT